MKYVSPEYDKTLNDLADLLLQPIGNIALQETIEPTPLFPAKPYLRLVEPDEAA